MCLHLNVFELNNCFVYWNLFHKSCQTCKECMLRNLKICHVIIGVNRRKEGVHQEMRREQGCQVNKILITKTILTWHYDWTCRCNFLLNLVECKSLEKPASDRALVLCNSSFHVYICLVLDVVDFVLNWTL